MTSFTPNIFMSERLILNVFILHLGRNELVALSFSLIVLFVSFTSYCTQQIHNIFLMYQLWKRWAGIVQIGNFFEMLTTLWLGTILLTILSFVFFAIVTF